MPGLQRVTFTILLIVPDFGLYCKLELRLLTKTQGAGNRLMQWFSQLGPRAAPGGPLGGAGGAAQNWRGKKKKCK